MSARSTADVDVVPGRGCGGCTLCCKLLGVEELILAPLQWCPRCDTSVGCTAYAERPTECRQFYCQYLLDGALDEHWKPSRCKMVVVLEDFTDNLVIHVDPDRPHAWRQAPFHTQIRRWAREQARLGRQVVVWQGDRKIMIDPRDPADLREPNQVGT